MGYISQIVFLEATTFVIENQLVSLKNFKNA